MTDNLQQRADAVMAHTYARYPLTLVKGEGTRLWDETGREYIDFISGIAVCSLGHSHPALAKAMAAQAAELVHVSNLFYTEPQVKLAEWLTARSFADKVFFCNSGAEANEAAIKLARRYGHQHKGADCHRIIAMEKSFHGRTMATLSATGQEKIREGFAPVLEGFDHVPYGDLTTLKKVITDQTCAIMLEPVQGEGGVRVPEAGYLEAVRRICDEMGLLLIFDEIQTGIGRTGTLFAYEHSGVRPHIMTLAKALGNGLPIGAMLAEDRVMASFTPGSHASTFGGTPLVTAGALAVLETLEKENLVQRCFETGQYFKKKLEGLLSLPVAKEVRGLGLLLGIELACEGTPLVKAMMEKGFIINCVQGNTLRFAPPFIITREEIDEMTETLAALLSGL
ncbi:acetylornithine aminotransferase apoenzyme [Desulfobotulus alkaliphilus]|uniref:Acetylornithine aminotransferase n=1 Tax=Desulfobotulus alkaliphilus TaxID=622671 RepID=A0A562RZK4_9BACT|nr:acetylornithine transaminase [Desulfobotulus alkaliphilus]TWI74408.1 acetylornithine aminotransferase apoenzyme [Desulfobotulus alkaliphilus]